MERRVLDFSERISRRKYLSEAGYMGYGAILSPLIPNSYAQENEEETFAPSYDNINPISVEDQRMF
ncbi:hypothetical protein KEJ50_02985 [Candidatus Bathyarchaeota archaeon]|nr:hypothetical protein [Candidatus Bathyarchaeota archaeon]